MRSTRVDRTTRAAPAAALVAMTVLGTTVAVAPSAAADPTRVDYQCRSANGPMPISLTYESELPDPPGGVTLSLSHRHDGRLAMRTEGALPAAMAQEASADGAEYVRVSGSIDLTTDYDLSPNIRGQRVRLADHPSGVDVPFLVEATHFLWRPGERVVTARAAVLTFAFTDGDGAVVGTPVELTCTASGAAVADTVWIRSHSQTSISLGEDPREVEHLGAPQPTFAYGEPVPVWAFVDVKDGPARTGWVDFTLDGVTRRVPVDVEGRAFTTFPGPTDRTATNPVVSDSNFVYATYVPADPRFYESSAVYPTLVPVTFAETTPRIRVSGKRTDRRARVRVRVDPEFDSTPTGEVLVKLRRLGTSKSWSRTKVLDDSRAVVRFRRLPRGRYKVVTGYRGDADHFGSKAVKRFRVRSR